MEQNVYVLLCLKTTIDDDARLIDLIGLAEPQAVRPCSGAAR